MLHHLHIRNYAIIASLEIDFTDHLNIITGETGAGKSILMGALGLVLGDRADTAVLQDTKNKCIVEAHFRETGRDVVNFLKENELEDEGQLIIRREISASGKSRAFINDTPVNLGQLKELSASLVDLHRQFEMLEVSKSDFQRAVLDALAGHYDLLHNYKEIFHQLKSVESRLATLSDAEATAEKEYDYHKFLYDELEEAAFSSKEIEDLEAEINTMGHAESIRNTLYTAYHALEDNEEPLVQQIQNMASKISALKEVFPSLEEVAGRLQSVGIELRDIASEIELLNGSVSYSEDRMNEMNERMSLAYGLLKKHHVQTTEELLNVKGSLEQKLEKSAGMKEEIQQLSDQFTSLEKQAKELAEELFQGRKSVIPDIIKKVNQLLSRVGMPNARFQATLASRPLHEFGGDSVAFLFDANKSGKFDPLGKVASGGELSRIMLVIKSLVAAKLQMPTLIFDEIDTGISGEAARQVALIMKALSEAHQILLVTHQPQIAARAHSHYLVYKEEKNHVIRTGIRKLESKERVHAIAVMLSGEIPTDAAVHNARELIMG